MHFLKSPLWAVVALLTLADAAPPGLEARADDAICKDVKEILGTRAIPLCQDYLGQPLNKAFTVTSITTQTNVQTTQLPAPTTRKTVHKTTTVFVTSKTITYLPNPTTTSVTTVFARTTTLYLYHGPLERRAQESGLKAAEKKYGKEVLRSACGCIWTPIPKTVTVTARVTRQTTTTVTLKPRSTKTITTTKVVSLTSKVAITTTLAATSTVTIASTTARALQVEVKEAQCRAQGRRARNYEPIITRYFGLDRKACINSCKAEPGCQAAGYFQYQWLENPPRFAQDCRRFDRAVEFATEEGVNEDFPYDFYDKDCPAVREAADVDV